MSFWKVLDSRYLERPTDWDALFERKAPLILEIGFGRGDHLIHLAKTNPQANVIGIEISQPSLKKASGKAKTNQLTNLRVIDGSAPTLLWVNILPQSLDQLHINFPDPWHKEGHQRRRLINPEFLHLAATRMKPDALLFVATDHPDYQPVVTECLDNSTHFDNRLESSYTTVDADRFQTKYEAKALREGRVPFYYQRKRNQTVAPDIFTIPEDLPVPHAVVQLPLSPVEIQERFEKFEVSEAEGRFLASFKAMWAAVPAKNADRAENPTLLVETYIKQSPQDQRLGIVSHSANRAITSSKCTPSASRARLKVSISPSVASPTTSPPSTPTAKLPTTPCNPSKSPNPHNKPHALSYHRNPCLCRLKIHRQGCLWYDRSPSSS